MIPMMTQLEKKMKAALRRFGIGASDSIVAAVSGGADSTAMLDALARLRLHNPAILKSIIVAHLNHQLRGEESDEDEAFVKRLADALNFLIFTKRIAVADCARQTMSNLEATARQLRYDFLQRTAEENQAGYVLTAHTEDDQAETVLMRLLRGSGANGLGGIHPIRPLGRQVKLVRPLLDVSRAEIIAHCEQYGLEFRNDSSNFSDDLTRNRIRHELLPLLRTFNPRINEAVVRSSTLVAEDDEYLDRLSEDLLASSIKSGIKSGRKSGPNLDLTLGAGPDEDDGARLNIPYLQPIHTAIRRRMLRQWIFNVRGNLERIDSKHLAAIERLISSGQSGRRVELPGHWIVRREFDSLTLSHLSETKQIRPMPVPLVAGTPQFFGNYEVKLLRHLSSEQWLQHFSFEQICASDEYAILTESAVLDELKLRARIAGDTYMPVNSCHKIKLKTLMIRNKIPYSERDAHPVIVSADDHILWAPGLPVARDFSACDRDGERALIIAQKLRNH